jgi:hypothetical protein
MAGRNDPSPAPEDFGAEFLPVTDPKTGTPVHVADLRAEFERLSHQVPRDPEAERAFLESKMEMIRTDPNLSAAAKERALEELRCRLKTTRG